MASDITRDYHDIHPGSALVDLHSIEADELMKLQDDAAFKAFADPEMGHFLDTFSVRNALSLPTEALSGILSYLQPRILTTLMEKGESGDLFAAVHQGDTVSLFDLHRHRHHTRG